MLVLAFRHVPFEGLGLIEPALRANHIEVEFADLYQAGAAPPDIAAYDALIFLGGPMSVNDDLPFLRQEMEFIRQAVAQRQPILGICLGSQLIARALGATVRPNATKEIGWYGLHFTEAAADDRLFRGLSSETVFHWHGETFDLPPDAELLASSDLCGHQAFRIGERVYAIQFHLEVTPEMIADWCAQDENSGDVRELEQPIDASFQAPRMAELSATVFGRWGEMLRLSGPDSNVATGDTGVAGERAKEEVAKVRKVEKAEEVAGPDHPTCPQCGWHNTRLSHTRSWLDPILRVFSLRAFRCRTCGNRFRVVRHASRE
jgi:GMP synthase-like glutamine amidotransferase